MKSISFTTDHYVRTQGNLVDLGDYLQRRQQAALPVQAAVGEGRPLPREEKPAPRPLASLPVQDRREGWLFLSDLCAAGAVTVLSLVMAVTLLFF